MPRRLLLIITLLLMVVPTGFAQQPPPETLDVVLADITADEDSDYTFEFLLAAIEAADESVLELLQDPDANVTLFAPTDEAFETLIETFGEETIVALFEDSDTLTQILQFHMIEGTATADEIVAYLGTDGEFAFPSMLEDTEITLQTQSGELLIVDAEVIDSDIFAENGIIFVIDTVLLPPQ